MDLWIKFFKDGTQEQGTEKDIRAGFASWSRGCLDNITSVKLAHKVRTCTLAVKETEWHQFDRYVAIISGGSQRPKLVCRAVQALIDKSHIGQYIIYTRSGSSYHASIVSEMPSIKRAVFVKPVLEHYVGSWLTIAMPHNDYPYIALAAKGSLHGIRQISR
jgi:hypothetical protein